MEGHQNMVVLALTRYIPIAEQSFSAFLDQCTIDERKSVFAYKHREDQLRSLLAITQLKYCFKTNFEKNITIIKNRYGKPKAVNWVGGISISHSKEWILTGISTHGNIGVDIEDLHPFPLIKGSEIIFLSENELSSFRSIQNRHAALDYLLTIWTLKEAYLKELGSGFIKTNPTSLSFNDRFKNNEECFTYNGLTGVSTLYTYRMDNRNARVSVSISGKVVPRIQFYQINHQSFLDELL